MKRDISTVKHIPESTKQDYPRIPWRDIAGMRDKVIHFYFGVNLESVWLTATEDIYLRLNHLLKKF